MKKIIAGIFIFFLTLGCGFAEDFSSLKKELKNLYDKNELILNDVTTIEEDGNTLLFLSNRTESIEQKKTKSYPSTLYLAVIYQDHMTDIIKIINTSSSPCYYVDEFNFVLHTYDFETKDNILVYYKKDSGILKKFKVEDVFITNIICYSNCIFWSTKNNGKVIHRLNTKTYELYSFDEYCPNALFYKKKHNEWEIDLYAFDPSTNKTFKIVGDKFIDTNEQKESSEIYEFPAFWPAFSIMNLGKYSKYFK